MNRSSTLWMLPGCSTTNGGQIRAAGANKTVTVPLVAPGLRNGFVKLRTALQASADPQNLPLLKQAVATAKRLGFDVQLNELINPVELDKAIAGKGSRDERMSLRGMLFRLGMIPA